MPTGASSVGPRFEGCVCVFGGVRGSNLGSVCVCHFPLICSKWWSLVKPHFLKKKKLYIINKKFTPKKKNEKMGNSIVY